MQVITSLQTHRSCVPFELRRNTHSEIRSGQLRVTSQHGNIVNAKKSKPVGLCDRHSWYHKSVIWDRWCLVNYTGFVIHASVQKSATIKTFLFGLETNTSEHPTHLFRSSVVPGFPISVGPKTSSSCSFSNLQTYPMTITLSLYYNPI